MELASYEFKDPGALLTEISAQHPLTPGTALLTVVEDPSTQQRLTHIEPLLVDSRVNADEDLSELLRNTMQVLPVPSTVRPPRHAVMTVLVRPGATIFGAYERRWFMGWRYSNHFMSAYTGDVTVVTEHGWCDFMTNWGGHSPSMVSDSTHRRRSSAVGLREPR